MNASHRQFGLGLGGCVQLAKGLLVQKSFVCVCTATTWLWSEVTGISECPGLLSSQSCCWRPRIGVSNQQSLTAVGRTRSRALGQAAPEILQLSEQSRALSQAVPEIPQLSSRPCPISPPPSVIYSPALLPTLAEEQTPLVPNPSLLAVLPAPHFLWCAHNSFFTYPVQK